MGFTRPCLVSGAQCFELVPVPHAGFVYTTLCQCVFPVPCATGMSASLGCESLIFASHLPRALEADRYNHITATYFLLAERILREKQEKQSHNLSLVYNLAQQVQNR